MRNPFRVVLNIGVAAAAALALAPVVFAPGPAFARGGGGGGGGRGGGSGGGSRGGGGKVGGGGGKSGGKTNKSGAGAAGGTAKNVADFLIQMQRTDSEDHRPDFLDSARADASDDERDKDRAAALAANREAESRQMRADDLARP